jgi:hypothetical protein
MSNRVAIPAVTGQEPREVARSLRRNADAVEKLKDFNIAADANIAYTKLHVAVFYDQTIGTSEVILPHGLAAMPSRVEITNKTTGGIVALSSAATRAAASKWYDVTNVYLIAAAAGQVVDVAVYVG